VRLAGTDEWLSNTALYPQASSRPRALGVLELTRHTRFTTRAYLYHQPAKGRSKRTLHGQRRRNKASLKHATRERAPWLLVSNLPPRRQSAKVVVKIYRERMAIEQSFRDLKAHRTGFAFRQSLGRQVTRIANLLLIAALGMVATWLVGVVGQHRGLTRGLQANTEYRTPVLSVFFIGTRLLHQRFQISFDELREALQFLAASIRHGQCECV
jgi:Transposase DDE domain